MRTRFIALGFLLLLLAGVFAVEFLFPREDTRAVDYSCRDGKNMTAVFHTGEKKTVRPGERPVPTGSVVVTLSDGRILSLPQTISASGVRYANADETFVFWSKGNGALVLEHNREKSYIGCVAVAPEISGSSLSHVFSNRAGDFSLRLPEGYTVDESFVYQLNPKTRIGGVQFTIPESLSVGTNLASDTYLSVEMLPNTRGGCRADMFLDGTYTAEEKTDGGTLYSFASFSGAGAGNRYEETVYALPGTNPCIAVRYMVHYGVFQNYEPGTVTEFDKDALLATFDSIRRTLVVNE